MKTVSINVEERNLVISEELKPILKRLAAKKYTFVSSGIIDDIDNNTLSISDYCEILDSIMEAFKRMVITYSEESYSDHYSCDEQLYDELKKSCKKYLDFFNHDYNNYALNRYSIDEDDVEYLSNMISDYYDIFVLEERMYKLRELKNYRFECLSNMEFFMSKEEIDIFLEEYDKALDNKDLDTLLRMVKDIQNKTLDEWKKYSFNPNMKDDNFCFIGHSVTTPFIKGEFRSKYVSCSLYNQDLNDTYNASYGFIMAPKNIVGADSSDMYVKNDTNDIEELTISNYLPKIRHPQRIINDCMYEKENNDNNEKVYNEVVIKGFEPVGIFFFSCGEKEIDPGYSNVLRLKEHFPNLEIHCFNRLNTKSKYIEDKYKSRFLRNLEAYTGNTLLSINYDDLSRYNLFFEEYNKLLEDGNYTIDDVVNALKNNLRLLEFFDTKPEKLFNGSFNDKEIKYVLGYNYNYDIENILNGNISTTYVLNKLVELIPYVNGLNKYYDGLEELVIMLSKVTVTEEMIDEINELDNISLLAITKCLVPYLSDKLNSQKDNITLSNEKFREDYQELIIEKNMRQNKKDKYNKQKNLLENEYVINIMQSDLKSIEISNTEIDINSKRLEQSLLSLVNNYNELLRKRENSEDDTLIALLDKRISLSKHSFINKRRIRKLDGKIRVCKNAFDEEINSQLQQIRIRIEMVKESLYMENMSKRQNDIERDSIYYKINKYFGCNTIEEAKDVIMNARKYVNNYDYSNDYYLDDIEKKLNKINNYLFNNNNLLNNIEKDEQFVESIKTR